MIDLLPFEINTREFFFSHFVKKKLLLFEDNG